MRLEELKGAGPESGAGLVKTDGRPTRSYQFTRTPNRTTRGATIAWIWLALVAFCVPRIAWTMSGLATLNTSIDGMNRRFMSRTGRSRWKSTFW